jgi:hypothetical protein
MSDYFFKMCDARSELAESRVTIENLVRVIENRTFLSSAAGLDSYKIQKEVSIKLAKEQIEKISLQLETDIHA